MSLPTRPKWPLSHTPSPNILQPLPSTQQPSIRQHASFTAFAIVLTNPCLHAGVCLFHLARGKCVTGTHQLLSCHCTTSVARSNQHMTHCKVLLRDPSLHTARCCSYIPAYTFNIKPLKASACSSSSGCTNTFLSVSLAPIPTHRIPLKANKECNLAPW